MKNKSTKKKQLPQNNFKRICYYTRPYWNFLLACLVFSLILVGINLYLSQIISTLVEQLQDKKSNGLVKYVYIIAGITVSGVISSYFVKYTAARFSFYSIRDIRSALYAHIEKINVSYIEQNHSGEIVSRLTNNIILLQEFLENNLKNFVYEPILFLGAFILLLRINGILLLISIVTMGITMGLTFIVVIPVKQRIKLLQKGIAKVNATYQDNINGVSIVKTYNLYDKLFNKYAYLLDCTLKESLSIEKINSLLVPIGTILGIGPIIVSVICGGYLCVAGILTSGELLAFIYLLDFLSNSAAMLPRMLTEYKTVSGVVEHLFEILDQPIEKEGGNNVLQWNAENIIEFNNAKFAYNDSNTVLEGVKFNVRKGTTVALVGSSGSGKSTIIKLICGFYELSEGRINLWGQPIETLDLKMIRSNISLVSQDIYLLPNTIAENIAYGMENVTIDEIVEAARAANADEFIQHLPNGYNTVLEERGNSLSGGQRQRIAIARAFLRKAPLVLLDEPTSALDTHSEVLIQESLERIRENSTVLVIAHRLSTIRNADEIIVLDKGKIVGRGTHEELMCNNLYYKQLNEQQMPQENYENNEERREHA
ncbi:ABC transporter ATP-binding protein [Cellulosilyticum ruminicola]|uniref:ABC transporter ATP-binding protein n=1 Tax=Cellulosilyticum ruminicola TaxID=425254 RepID=UPI0006D147FA|nr:ABC transporter ATP-binding protein [Cellulosilyticum ruminicola]